MKIAYYDPTGDVMLRMPLPPGSMEKIEAAVAAGKVPGLCVWDGEEGIWVNFDGIHWRASVSRETESEDILSVMVSYHHKDPNDLDHTKNPNAEHCADWMWIDFVQPLRQLLEVSR